MDGRDAPRTTRARTGLALFAATFGFGDSGGDLRANGNDMRADGGERD